MKANELRIGNWYDHNGVPKQVTPSTIEEVWDAERIWCKPIPLTEEWLVKFGFVKYIDEDKFIHKSLRYSDQFKLRDDGVLVYVSSEVYITDCKYVHQLQNLYFALTGEELTIGGQDER